jgi:hypothetical protein
MEENVSGSQFMAAEAGGRYIFFEGSFSRFGGHDAS